RKAHRQAHGTVGWQPDRRNDPAHPHRHKRLAGLPACGARNCRYQLSAPEARLILVTNSLPEVVEGKRPSSWLLSSKGRKRCAPLAERLRDYDPEIIITSTEPRANETGLLVAEALGVSFETA